MPLRRQLFTICCAAGVVGCANPFVPEGVPGTYVLQTVNGSPVPLPGLYNQVSGWVTLSDGGRLERRISFRVDSAGTLRELAYVAAYRVRGSVLEVAVQGDGPPRLRTWRAFGEIASGTLTIPIPLPADGYDIEVYERR